MSPLTTRAAREAEARRLRESGLMLKEIGQLMAASISTVDAWLNDPGGRRLAARKASYRGACRECGKPTTGHNGRTAAPTICNACYQRAQAKDYAALSAEIAAGSTAKQAAARRGVSAHAVYERLRKHGDNVTRLRERTA